MIRRSLLLGVLLTSIAAAQGEPEKPDAEKLGGAVWKRTNRAAKTTLYPEAMGGFYLPRCAQTSAG